MAMMAAQRPADLTPVQVAWLDATEAADPGSPFLNGLRVARRWWWQILLLALLGTGLGYGGARVAPRQYLAQAYVLLDAETLRAVLTLDDLFRSQPVDSTTQFINDQIGELRSRRVTLQAVRRLGLASLASDDEQRAVDDLQSRLDVSRIIDTTLIEISYADANPERAADVANEIATAYLQFARESRAASAAAIGPWLDAQLAGIRERTREAAQQLQALREAKGVVDAGPIAQEGVGRQIEQAQVSLVEARARAAAASAVLDLARVRPESAPIVAGDAEVVRARQLVAQREAAVASMSERLGRSHPTYVTALAELDAARRGLRVRIAAVLGRLEREAAATQRVVASLESGLVGAQAQLRMANRGEPELERLTREYLAAQEIQQRAEIWLQETRSTAVAVQPPARLVESASVPSVPWSPRPKLWGFFLGLFAGGAGLLAALWYERTRAPVRSEDEIDGLGVPLLAEIPFAQPVEAATPTHLRDRDPRYDAAVRDLAATVRVTAGRGQPQTLLFTSVLDAEGKSTLSLAYAAALARSERVVLVECDLRRPVLARRLGVADAGPGLSEWVRGPAIDFESMFRHVEGLGLTLIPAGLAGQPVNAVLDSPRFATLLRNLKATFDVIVLDSPPVHLVSDAMYLVRHVDGVVLVVRSGHTSAQTLAGATGRLHAAGAAVLGVALNMHRRRGRLRRAARRLRPELPARPVAGPATFIRGTPTIAGAQDRAAGG